MKFSDDLKVSDALKLFYGVEHLSDEAFTRRINYVRIGILTLPFPNPKPRREIVHLHDVNHILSGYDTSWIGEGEVSAWELATGFPWHCWIGYFYSPITLVIGFILNPTRVIKAFARGRQQKNACYAQISKQELFDSTVGDLKRRLGHK